MLPLAASPRLPEMAAPRSVRMSPNRFDATMTSSVCGMRHHARGERVDVVLLERDVRIVLAHFVDDRVPQHHRMLQRVRFRRARKLAPRTLRRQLERIARDAADAVAREETRLLHRLERRPGVNLSADAGVLALRSSRARRSCRCRRGRDSRAASSRPETAASAEGSRTDRTAAAAEGSAPTRRCGRAPTDRRRRRNRSRETRRGDRTRRPPSCGRSSRSTRSRRETPRDRT